MMHEAYTDEEQLGDTTIFHWHKASNGKETAVLLPHVARLLSICTEDMANTVSALVREDRHITVQQFVEALDLSKSSVRTILYEKLKMQIVAASWVPHFLTREQKYHCIEIFREWLKRIEDKTDL